MRYVDIYSVTSTAGCESFFSFVLPIRKTKYRINTFVHDINVNIIEINDGVEDASSRLLFFGFILSLVIRLMNIVGFYGFGRS